MTAEITSTALLAAIAVRGPIRSTNRPIRGANANIPRVCAEMTLPTELSPKPLFSMWIGVPDMIRTITNWPTGIATSAICTR